jgi:hypothetical protein
VALVFITIGGIAVAICSLRSLNDNVIAAKQQAVLRPGKRRRLRCLRRKRLTIPSPPAPNHAYACPNG